MQLNINKLSNYLTISTLDLHTEGEPLRIITSGCPELIGDTILEKRQYARENVDHIRQLLMFEPRGHADMYGAVLTDPVSPNAHFGVLFLHNEGYSSMCGHAIIAIVTAMVETQQITASTIPSSVIIDTPAGQVTAYAFYDNNDELQVSFDNVPSYIEAINQVVSIPELGEVHYDVAFGGAFYAFVDADKHQISCHANNTEQLIDLGRKIKHAIVAHGQPQHPIEQDLSFLYGTIFYSHKTTNATSHSRHVCIFADGEVDRSPTGTGVSARAALLSKYQPQDKRFIIESIVDGKMTVEQRASINFHGKQAIIARVSGRAFVTGTHQFLLGKNDIFPNGFLLR